MENALTRRAVLVGHLELTLPAIAGVLLVPFFGLRMFGPSLFLYYLLAGIALAWQWYSVVAPSWKQWLVGRGVPQEEADNLAHRAGLAWPARIAGIGFFALHTTAAAICGIHLGPWLLSRWHAWILPLLGMSSHTPTGNDWLQHFELTSIVPALVVGYLLSRYSGRLATYAWVLPTAILVYKLLTFTEPQASVLAPHSSMRWEYFFVIQRRMPTVAIGFGGVDPTYDSLNRITTAATQGATCTSCWGQRFGHLSGSTFVPGIDAWGNLFEITVTQGSAGTLSQSATLNNQFLGMTYDASGNLTNDGGGHSFTFDDENRLTGAAGYTYVYDGDGKRVKKCSNSGCTSGTLYWTGMGSDALSEAGVGGGITEEYIFLNGERVARRDASGGAVHYYFSDHLKSADVITSNIGAIQEESDYYPYGGEVVVTGSDINNYKFTGKERDAESGLDYFSARHYSNAFGRFMQADWAAKPTDVPYANFGNPQSLNLYSYVQNNPTTIGDPDGHDAAPCGCGGMTAEDYHFMWRDVSQYVSDRASWAWAGVKIDAAKIAYAAGAATGAISGLYFSKDAEAGQLQAAGRDATNKANAAIEKASHDKASFKDPTDVQEHIDKLSEGVARVGDLSKQLDQTKGKAERDKIKAKLKAEIKEVNGHEKDLSDKPKDKKKTKQAKSE